MNIQTKTVNGVLVARILDPRIDAHGAPDLKGQLGAQVDAGAQQVVLNMADVDFVDSTGLGALLSLLKRLSPGGTLVLCGCRPGVVELMRLTRLDRVLRLFESERAALASLSA